LQCKKLIYLLLVAHHIFLDYVKFPELLLISRTAFYFSLESNTPMRAPKTPVVQARFIRVAHTSMNPDNSFFGLMLSILTYFCLLPALRTIYNIIRSLFLQQFLEAHLTVGVKTW